MVLKNISFAIQVFKQGVIKYKVGKLYMYQYYDYSTDTSCKKKLKLSSTSNKKKIKLLYQVKLEKTRF